MTNPEHPDLAPDPRDDALVDDAVSWFAGRAGDAAAPTSDPSPYGTASPSAAYGSATPSWDGDRADGPLTADALVEERLRVARELHEAALADLARDEAPEPDGAGGDGVQERPGPVIEAEPPLPEAARVERPSASAGLADPEPETAPRHGLDESLPPAADPYETDPDEISLVSDPFAFPEAPEEPEAAPEADPEAPADLPDADPLPEPPADAIDSEAPVPASLFRDPDATAPPAPDATAVLAPDEAVEDVDPETLAARRRAEEREARDRQLGKVQPGDQAPAPTPFTLPSTYGVVPSLGLLVLRWVAGGVVGVRAFLHAMDIAALQKLWVDHTILASSATAVAWVQVAAEAVVALMLLLGLGTRVAGLLLTGVSVCLLAFMLWGAGNPFQPGVVGFIGELELLMAGVGLMFLAVGGGGWSIDAGVHRGRIDRKNERLLA